MTADLAETLTGIAPGSPLSALRRQREKIRQHIQGAFEALVTPADPGGITRAERAALALRVALIEQDFVLSAHLRDLLAELGTQADRTAAELFPAPPTEGRLGLLLAYADLVATTPERCTQAEIDALSAHGLSPQDIVAVTQLISFVPFQTRLMAGLRALQQETQA